MSIADKTFSYREVLQSHSRMDDMGRCCGKKPIKYKITGGPHYFCQRCDRGFSLETLYQIPNWAWRFEANPDRYVKTTSY